MPRTLSFPPPSTATCPICSSLLSDPHCERCGATFSGEDGATLWRVDHDLYDLCRIRNEVVHRLLTAASPPAGAWSALRSSAPEPISVDDATSPTQASPASPEDWEQPATRDLEPATDRPPATGATARRPDTSVGVIADARGPEGVAAAQWASEPTPPKKPAAPAAPGSRRDASVDPPVAAQAAGSDPHDGTGQAPPPPTGPPRHAPRPRPSFTAAEVLVGLGALSLVAAVAVFAAVSWSDLAAWAQGGLIVALTGVVLAAAVACRRRDLVATSESLGAVAVALGLADVQVARVGLDGIAPGRAVWAVGLAVVAAGAFALGRRSGIRVLGLAGGALAFAPLVVAASGGRPLVWVSALAVQAVVGGIVATRLADRRPDRTVTAVGAALSWTASAAAAVGLAAAGLAAEPVAHPVGPAVVLTGLAVATIVLARRLGPGGDRLAELVGGAGAALALVPAVVLALGSGEPLTVLTVLASQGLVALAARPHGTRGERAVALVGGAASWIMGAVGLLALAASQLVDGEPVTGPALVLAALAAGSIALARRTDEDVLLPAAGSAIAFVPAVLLAAGTGAVEAVLAVVAAQALIALGLATTDRLTATERAVAVVGGATCWVAAVALGLAVGAGQALAGTSPVATVSILAALAAGSIVLARRASEEGDVLGAAGSALAFTPALLLAAGTGELEPLLAVFAAQALLALGLIATSRLTTAERAVAGVGGATCWIVVAAVGLAIGAGQALAGTAPVATSAILATLAAGSIALARRSDAEPADVLGAGGSLLSLAPALLLVGSTGSAEALFAVAAAQAVVALGLAGAQRTGAPLLTEPERAVAVVGGWVLGVAAASGSLFVALLHIGFAPDEPEPRLAALLVLAGLAAASIVVGATSRRASLTAAGAAVAFVPVPLSMVGVASPSVLVAVLLGEVLSAALVATFVDRGPVRTVLHSGGAIVWTAGVVGAGLLGLDGWIGRPEQGPAGSIALLLAFAAVAVGAALLSRWERTPTGVALAAAVVPVLVGAALAAGGLGSDGWVAAVLATAAVVALGTGLLGRVDDRPWVAPSSVALAAGAALAVVPVRSVLVVVAALLDRASTTPDVGSGVALVDWLRPALAETGFPVPGWALVVQLAGAAVLAGAVALLHPRVGRAVGLLVGLGAVVAVPVVAGLTVAATVVGLGLVVVAAAVVVRVRPRDKELLVAAGALALVGTAVAVASAPWLVGWTVLVALAVAALGVDAVVRERPEAAAWVGTAVGVVLAGVALDAWVLGASGIDGLLAVAAAAAVVSPVAAVLERRGLDDAADVVDVLVAVALVSAPLAAPVVTGSVFSLSPLLAVVGVTAGCAALRPRRREAWLVATGCAVLLAWLQAGEAELVVVEAYTLPLAAWALLVGGVAGRRLGSWERYGVGLLTAAGPTTVFALADPGPLRTVGVVALGAAVAVWGAAARLQAPLAVGSAAVAVLAVRHLGPVGVDLPRYVAFAVAGLVLLAVGATFEQRRQDLRSARDAFVRLR